MKTRGLIVMLPLLALALFSCNNNAQQSAGTNNQQAAPASADAGSVDANTLFATNCAMCHNPDADGTGPRLKGALARWDGDRNGIKAFIRNPAKSIADGDKHAVAAYNKFSHTQMTSFAGLTDAEIDALINTYMK